MTTAPEPVIYSHSKLRIQQLMGLGAIKPVVNEQETIGAPPVAVFRFDNTHHRTI